MEGIGTSSNPQSMEENQDTKKNFEIIQIKIIVFIWYQKKIDILMENVPHFAKISSKGFDEDIVVNFSNQYFMMFWC